MTDTPLDRLAAIRILPVVTVDDPRDAAPLVAALVDAGLATVEITLRTRAAIDAIRRAAGVPGATVGAGTVTSTAQVIDAIEAGAQFLVSPGTTADVIGVASEHGVPMIPGVATATELQHALGLGCSIVKLFPAEVIGGPALVDALGAVWPEVRFVPTGGIAPSNAGRYLASPRVLAVGGSWMVPRTEVADRDWVSIRGRAAAAALLGRGES